jgi:hypothetical protein
MFSGIRVLRVIALLARTSHRLQPPLFLNPRSIQCSLRSSWSSSLIGLFSLCQLADRSNCCTVAMTSSGNALFLPNLGCKPGSFILERDIFAPDGFNCFQFAAAFKIESRRSPTIIEW